jgi:hypothetical protein
MSTSNLFDTILKAHSDVNGSGTVLLEHFILWGANMLESSSMTNSNKKDGGIPFRYCIQEAWEIVWNIGLSNLWQYLKTTTPFRS